MTATLGTGPKDWVCTRDNITGLLWEVKATSGLRNKDHTYSWFQRDTVSSYIWSVTNVDYLQNYLFSYDPGFESRGVCETTGRCDTTKYTEDVNVLGLCGKKDWRLPRIYELQGIADFSRINPSIDLT